MRYFDHFLLLEGIMIRKHVHIIRGPSKKSTWKAFFLLSKMGIITICWVSKNQNIVQPQTNFKGWIIETMKNLSGYSAKIILSAFRISKQIFHIYWGFFSTGQNVNLKWIFDLSSDRPNVYDAFEKDRMSISYSYLELEPVLGRFLRFFSIRSK